MELHFRNLKYVRPPGSLTDFLPHPIYPGKKRGVEISIFIQHRYAFFFWNKWTIEIVCEEDLINCPPCLVTLDWHQDLSWPDSTEKMWLDDLDLNNNRDVEMHAWANLSPLNDNHIMAAVYLNLVGNVYVHCRQGSSPESWEDREYKDKYGNIHTIKKFKEYEALERHMLNSDEMNVYFDIDLDFFTIHNALSPSSKISSYTYLSNSVIREMLDVKRPLITWIFERLWGITIALEPEHTGGLMKSHRLLAY